MRVPAFGHQWCGACWVLVLCGLRAASLLRSHGSLWGQQSGVALCSLNRTEIRSGATKAMGLVCVGTRTRSAESGAPAVTLWSCC